MYSNLNNVVRYRHAGVIVGQGGPKGKKAELTLKTENSLVAIKRV